MKRTLLILAASLLATAALRAQDDEEKDELVIVKAGKVITVSGEELDNATIVIRNGKIEAVGTNVEYPFGGKVIDASGMTVMPGMINPHSRLGVPRAGSGTRPNNTLGGEYFVTPETYERIVASGYTTLGLTPTGRTMPGRTLVIRTWAENTAGLAMTDEGPVFIDFNEPGVAKPAVDGAFKRAQAEIDKIKKAKEAWEKKQKADAAKKKAEEAKKKKEEAEKKKDDEKDPKKDPKTPPKKSPPAKKPEPARFVPPKINPLYQPLVDLIQKKKGEIARVEMGVGQYFPLWGGRTIKDGGTYLQWRALEKTWKFARAFKFNNTVVGENSPFFVTPETDLNEVAGHLGEDKSLTAIYPVINHYKFTRNKYNLGLALRNAGCRVVYVPERDNWTGYVRMRDALARMVRAGYPREEILRTVTLHPAEMLGMEDELGSIQPGRYANLVFLDGDPLSFSTQVKKVMIDGNLVPLKKLVY